MYTCSNCGVEFEGRVCPNCCTMRPAAAVLGDSGRILKRPSTGAELSPGQRAVKLAEDIEQSRLLDARRQEKLRHDEEMRRRAAELAEAAKRQEEAQAARREEKRRLERQAQKASNWQPKAPASRAADDDDGQVVMPDALRSLKISSDSGRKAVEKDALNQSLQKAREKKDISSYPAAASIPPRKGGRGLSSAPSERIDAAWKAFAGGKKHGES